MLDRLLSSAVAFAAQKLKRPVLVFAFTLEPGIGFRTSLDGSEGVTMHHLEGAATDLLRMMSEDLPDTTTCPCCLARRVRVATALQALTGGEGTSSRVTH